MIIIAIELNTNQPTNQTITDSTWILMSSLLSSSSTTNLNHQTNNNKKMLLLHIQTNFQFDSICICHDDHDDHHHMN